MGDEAQIKYDSVHQKMMILLESSKLIRFFKKRKFINHKIVLQNSLTTKKYFLHHAKPQRKTKNPCICICICIDAARNDWLQYYNTHRRRPFAFFTCWWTCMQEQKFSKEAGHRSSSSSFVRVSVGKPPSPCTFIPKNEVCCVEMFSINVRKTTPKRALCFSAWR